MGAPENQPARDAFAGRPSGTATAPPAPETPAEPSTPLRGMDWRPSEGDVGEVPTLDHGTVLSAATDGVGHRALGQRRRPTKPCGQRGGELRVLGGPRHEGTAQCFCACRFARLLAQGPELRRTRCRGARSAAERPPHQFTQRGPCLTPQLASGASCQRRQHPHGYRVQSPLPPPAQFPVSWFRHTHRGGAATPALSAPGSRLPAPGGSAHLSQNRSPMLKAWLSGSGSRRCSGSS